MSYTNRREFLRASSALALAAAVPADLFAQAATVPVPSGTAWDTGVVRHLLPTVNDTRMLIKVSLNAPLTEAPSLRVGDTSVQGRMGDTHGEHLAFLCHRSAPGTQVSAGARRQERRALCASPGSSRPFRRRTSGRTSSGCCSSPAPAAMRP